MQRVGICAVVAFLWLLTSLGQAQDLTGRQQEILRTAIAIDGWLTEPMHREFWSSVPKAVRSDPATVAAIAAAVNRASVAALRFQRATWSSVRLSLAKKRTVKTSDYEAAKAEVLNGATTPLQRASAEKGVRNADAMLAAAATGRSMNGPRGPFYVTEELVDSVLGGLEGAFHRLLKLSNPTWSNHIKEHRYPQEHVTILWDGPFTREAKTITTETGKTAQLSLLTYRVSEGEHVAVGFMRLHGQWLDPEAASIRTAAATLSGMGIRDGRPTVSRWRGRLAAEAAGSAHVSTGAIHASVRIVQAPEYGGAWQFLAISGASVVDAITLRARLEAASKLEAQAKVPISEGRAGCIPIEALFKEELPRMGTKDLMAIQLKRGGGVWHIVFTQRAQHPGPANGKWIVASRYSAERPEIYCVLGTGNSIEPLVSLHNTNFTDRFGMPGSNYPRCGDPRDPLEGVKVRAWASKELRDSTILALSSEKSSQTSFVLLLSKIDDQWILLEKRANEGTCYRDRGTAADARKLQLK